VIETDDLACCERVTVFGLVEKIAKTVRDCEEKSNDIKQIILEPKPEKEFEKAACIKGESTPCLISALSYILTDAAKLATILDLIKDSLV